MSRRLLAVLCLALVLMAVFAATSSAQGTTKQVGLVIALPNNQTHAEIVTVPDSATAFDALQKASIQLVSSTAAFGPAICSINGTGCGGDNCFCDKSHFWAYYHLDPQTGKWTAAQEGVGAYKPANGAVEGFVWSGLDASFNPTDQPPVMTLAQIKAGTGSAVQAGAAVTATATISSTGGAPAALPTTGGSDPVWPWALAAALIAAGGLLVWRARSLGL